MILRRVDDSFCDPLELRSDSLLGVPGLVDAIVAGNVKVANALGSGVIETAAIMPFLPGLSQAPDWREAEASLRRDLVVRTAVRARLGAQSSRFRRGKAGVSIARHGAGIRRRNWSRRRKASLRAHCGQSPRVCGTGAGRVVHRAGLGQRTPSLAQRGAAHLRAQHRQWMDRDSRRTGARCRRAKGRSSPCSAADTARTPGCCGTARSTPSACCTRAINPLRCAVSRRACPAAWPTMSSGWDDMSSARRTRRASCAPWSPACAGPTRPNSPA